MGHGGRQSYFEQRRAKLAAQAPSPSSSSTSCPPIFAGLCLYVNGFTPRISGLQLKKLIQEHGGSIDITFAKRRVTHVVATNLSGKKEDDELRKQGGRRKTCIVSPQWVLDSIAARRRLPENEYLVVRERNVATLDDLFARKRQHEQTPITIDDDEEEEEKEEEAKAKDKEDKGPSSSSNPLLALMRAHKKPRIDCYT